MSGSFDRGITVTEIAPMGQPIEIAPETTAAFVGRALRGPLNTPILIHRFGEFCRRFGSSWSGSSLGPAVQQFFEHGGQNLYIVRVANNARSALICMPAGGSALVLRAMEPGSTERIRAASAALGPLDVVGLSHEVFPERHWGVMAESETFAHLEHLVSSGWGERWRDGDRFVYRF